MATQTEQTPAENTNQDWTDAIEQSDNLEGDAEVTEVAEQEVPEAGAAPDPTPEPVQVPTTPSAEEARLLEENTRLLRVDKERQREAEDLRIHQVASDKAQEWAEALIRDGWEEEKARQYAQSAVALRVEQYKNINTSKRLVAAEENIPLEVLNGAQDEATMRQRAQQHKQMAGPQREELDSMKREMAQLKVDLKKAQVPAQSYDQPSGASGSSSDNDTWIKYGRGELEWSPQVKKAGAALGFL